VIISRTLILVMIILVTKDTESTTFWVKINIQLDALEVFQRQTFSQQTTTTSTLTCLRANSLSRLFLL